MNTEELTVLRLYRQHITNPADTLTVIRNLNGLQAQFLSFALHAARIRTQEPFNEDVWKSQLIKSWTLRGTMHIFAQDDLPLFLHQGRSHFLRDIDTFADDPHISAERKRMFASRIVQWIAQGINERELLKEHCRKLGMTADEEESLFNSWGGVIHALAEDGQIAYQVQEKKAFRLCPPFVPMEELPARLEILRRYFLHYGPATVKDASYYLGKPQSQIKDWMARLPLSDFSLDGKTYFYIGTFPSHLPETPPCILAAGFDPLLLGYDKTQNPLLPPDYLRNIFNLSGIVMPPIILHGKIIGRWKRQGKQLILTAFEPLDRDSRQEIENAAETIFTTPVKIQWK